MVQKYGYGGGGKVPQHAALDKDGTGALRVVNESGTYGNTTTIEGGARR